MSTEPDLVVVDASVAVKWLLPELDSPQAACLLDDRFLLLAPDLLPIEVANALWKEVRAGGLTPQEARSRGEFLERSRLTLVPSGDLIPAALEVAVETGRTVYDCLYLALAQREQGLLVTADTRFLGGLGGTAYGGIVRHLGDMRFEEEGE